MRGEWKAWLTRSLVVLRPRAAKWAATAPAGVLVACDDDGAGTVDGGERHGVLTPVEQRQDLLLGRLDRDHGAALRQGLHQPAPGGDQTARVGQGEHPGDVGGGEFADGVADQVGGAYAEGLQQPEEGDLDGEQGFSWAYSVRSRSPESASATTSASGRGSSPSKCPHTVSKASA